MDCVESFDYTKFYPIWDSAKNKVEVIRKLGGRHYVVELKKGWCYKDNGVHRYIIDNFSLYNSVMDNISTCACINCIISGQVPKGFEFIEKK